MRRTSSVVVVVLLLLVAFAVIGDSQPEGNVIREATEWLRVLGRKFADGFGGGYNPGTG